MPAEQDKYWNCTLAPIPRLTNLLPFTPYEVLAMSKVKQLWYTHEAIPLNAKGTLQMRYWHVGQSNGFVKKLIKTPGLHIALEPTCSVRTLNDRTFQDILRSQVHTDFQRLLDMGVQVSLPNHFSERDCSQMRSGVILVPLTLCLYDGQSLDT